MKLPRFHLPSMSPNYRLPTFTTFEKLKLSVGIVIHFLFFKKIIVNFPSFLSITRLMTKFYDITCAIQA